MSFDSFKNCEVDDIGGRFRSNKDCFKYKIKTTLTKVKMEHLLRAPTQDRIS